MNHIAKNNLFKPIVDVFVGNGSRYNLLNSAVLELFEYIRKVLAYSVDVLCQKHVGCLICSDEGGNFIQDNLKILVKYIVETFWEQLVKFDSLPSLQSLKVKYEQVGFI